MFQIQRVKHISEKLKNNFLSTMKNIHIFAVIFWNACHGQFCHMLYMFNIHAEFTIYTGLPDLLNLVYETQGINAYTSYLMLNTNKIS
jgi:hypothetical protein